MPGASIGSARDGIGHGAHEHARAGRARCSWLRPRLVGRFEPGIRVGLGDRVRHVAGLERERRLGHDRLGRAADAGAGIAMPTSGPTSPPSTIPTDGPTTSDAPTPIAAPAPAATTSRRPVMRPTASPAIAAGNTMSRPRTAGSGIGRPEQVARRSSPRSTG